MTRGEHSCCDNNTTFNIVGHKVSPWFELSVLAGDGSDRSEREGVLKGSLLLADQNIAACSFGVYDKMQEAA